MRWIFTAFLLSTGLFQEIYTTEEDCRDGMLLAEIMTGDDLFAASCAGPDGVEFSSIATRDFGP